MRGKSEYGRYWKLVRMLCSPVRTSSELQARRRLQRLVAEGANLQACNGSDGVMLTLDEGRSYIPQSM